MDRNEYHSFKAEIKTLEDLLAEIPEQNLLERLSLEARLRSAKSAIEGAKEPPEAFKAQLTFKGKPVLGCHGIAADFGSTASSLFSEVITTIAAGLTGDLQDTGPIPAKQKNQLLITGTAIGSFGFEYELPLLELSNEHLEQSNLEKAIELAQNLFQCSTDGSDDDIAEIMDEISPRAIKKTAEFLSYVKKHDAWCAIDFKNRSFHFQDLEQISNSSRRLQENNIRESTQDFKGEFQGILPASRTFEFKCKDSTTIIKGKISQNIAIPDELNRKYLHKPIQVVMHVTQFGNGKPRYSLSSLEDITF